MKGLTRAAAAWAMAVLASTSVAAPGAKAAAGNAGKKDASVAASAAVTAAAPVEFEGTLEAGKTYVAEVAWDNNALHIWRPIVDVKVPRQHAWTIDWTNLARFPALKTNAARARPQRFRFTVAGVDVSSGSPMIPWTTIYHCDVIAVEALAAPPAAAPKRK
ncbi:MAG: hypothetical protein ABI745_16260 [Caldimonas sp.]